MCEYVCISVIVGVNRNNIHKGFTLDVLIRVLSVQHKNKYFSQKNKKKNQKTKNKTKTDTEAEAEAEKILNIYLNISM